MSNVAAYNGLAAHWATVMASGFTGEIHVLADTYAFSAAHGPTDIAAVDLTAPNGCLNQRLTLGSSGLFSAGPFQTNPVSLVIPAHSGDYRFLAWCIPTSHIPLLWIDLGASHAVGTGDTAIVTFTGSFVKATT